MSKQPKQRNIWARILLDDEGKIDKLWWAAGGVILLFLVLGG